MRQGWLGLLPLVILTKGGKQPKVVNEMIEKLALAQEYDLMAIARLLGGLVFKEGSDESDWFKRRFYMFQDILRESWVYQEIGQEYFEQGREEERQEELQRQRQTVLSFVQRHFSEVVSLAKQQTDRITEPEVLQTVILRLLAAQTVEEARQILLNLDQNQNHH